MSNVFVLEDFDDIKSLELYDKKILIDSLVKDYNEKIQKIEARLQEYVNKTPFILYNNMIYFLQLGYSKKEDQEGMCFHVIISPYFSSKKEKQESVTIYLDENNTTDNEMLSKGKLLTEEEVEKFKEEINKGFDEIVKEKLKSL